jgi:YD repeat-containing protein
VERSQSLDTDRLYTDAQNHVSTYAYDSRGNRTSVIDPINGSAHPTTFGYDAMNRLTGITYPDGTSASFQYDSRGQRTSATYQNSKPPQSAPEDAKQTGLAIGSQTGARLQLRRLVSWLSRSRVREKKVV